jgi:hypothetical protein
MDNIHTEHPKLIPSLTLHGVAEAERDVAIFRLACKLKRAGVPQEHALQLLPQSARTCTPPYPRDDALKKALRAYMGYPEGIQEELVMLEEQQARPDPTLRALTSGGNMAFALDSKFESPDLVELGGDELAQIGMHGTDATSGPPSLPFLGQPGYIIEGWSHLLAGYPRSGKTELLVRLCRQWLDLGRRIVYFTEEPQSIWQHRLARLAGDWAGLRIVLSLGQDPNRIAERAFSHPRGQYQPEGTQHSALNTQHSVRGEAIVVIDAMRNLLRLDDETDNSRIAHTLNPWVSAARQAGKTLIMVHHLRKGAGDYGESIAGGHALLGLFDVALVVQRQDRAPMRRKVATFARIVRSPDLIYELRKDGSMAFLGDPSSLQLNDVMERVRPSLGHEWHKTAEVRERLGEPVPALNQVRSALLALADQGLIERDPSVTENAAGRTVRWRLKQT